MIPTPVVSLLLLFTFVYSTETLDYSPLTFCHNASIYSNFGSNQLLSNALNKYHPFVLYLSFTLALFAYGFKVLRWNLQANFLELSASRLWSRTQWVIIQINLLALWMGSWWALQEGTWGGWWNWDSSETFGLLITLSFLTLTHSRHIPSKRLFFSLKFTSLVAVVLCSYVFMQINFELVSHNFGSKFFFFFNNNLFFLEVVVSTTLTATAVLRLSNGRKNLQALQGVLKSRETQFSTRSLILIFPAVIGAFWLAWSFRPLLSHFLWKFFEINALNSEGSLQMWHLFSALLLFIMLTPKSSLDPILPVIALCYTPTWTWALVFIALKKFKFSLVHTSIFWFTILNISLANSTLFSWVTVAPYSYLPFGACIELQASALWVLDTGIIEIVNPWRSAVGFTSIDWNQFGCTNSPALNFFSLELSHSTSRNLYVLGETYSSVLLDLEVPLIGSLNMLFFLLLISLF